MAGRWVINPVVTLDELDGETGEPIGMYRIAKAGSLIEPGRGKPYQHTSIIDTGGFALTYVIADDFSALDADSQIIDVLETNVASPGAILDATPASLGWSAARMIRIRNRLEARGVDTTGLAADSTIAEILERIAQAIASWGRVRRVRL